MTQKRIAAGTDRHLQSTQYGFRKDKSTSDAIYLIRRIAEYCIKARNKLALIFLDWEKAFDEIDRGRCLKHVNP